MITRPCMSDIANTDSTTAALEPPTPSTATAPDALHCLHSCDPAAPDARRGVAPFTASPPTVLDPCCRPLPSLPTPSTASPPAAPGALRGCPTGNGVPAGTGTGEIFPVKLNGTGILSLAPRG
ncbi:hypothetical protein PR202_gb00892 [Eleusine coracana subsp. coracana]|uniref:Uncharacterized protein n=1 Tax=Eleusine coracana subsp. coracana TaxID=191504 RepID=A0AAV5DW08_ELECO|nr:hypothetical protein PR202_gb00892 [Eleusine coracana subsp. coracana]